MALLLKPRGTLLTPSTADHPQTDGKTKRVNRWWEEYLEIFALTLKQHGTNGFFCYNNTKHTFIDMSTFETMYGCKVHVPTTVVSSAVARFEGSFLLGGEDCNKSYYFSG